MKMLSLLILKKIMLQELKVNFQKMEKKLLKNIMLM